MEPSAEALEVAVLRARIEQTRRLLADGWREFRCHPRFADLLLDACNTLDPVRVDGDPDG